MHEPANRPAPKGRQPTTTRAPSSAAADSRRIMTGCAGVLVVAALIAYRSTFRVPFLLDDTFAIAGNPTIRHLDDLRHVLLPNVGYGITVSGRPLLNLSLALCYAISGTHVWSYHAFNLLVHILAGLTLFGIVRRTLARIPGRAVIQPWQRAPAGGKQRCESNYSPAPAAKARAEWLRRTEGADPTLPAFAVALIWTLHPLQTEAVTYIIQRTESLMGLFFLFTFYAFVRSVSSHRPWIWRGLAVLACLAAVGTKEVAVMIPPLVFLYDRTFVARTFREAWSRRRWLHLSLAATWLPLGALVASTGWNRGGTAGFDVGVSPWAYWCTQSKAVTDYLKLSLWPHPLVFEHGKFQMGFRDAAPYMLIVVPLVAATIVALWRRPAAGFLGAWFLGILAPTSLVPGTIQMIVEHRMYLPLAAVITAVGLGLDTAVKQGLPIARRLPTTPLLPCLALAFPLGWLTVQRNALYRDDLGLWRQTVRDSPSSALAQSCLGTALYQRNQIREALGHYRISLELDPSLVSNHYNLGLAYSTLGRLPEAIRQYRKAVHINSQFFPAHYQLGLALLQLKRPEEALAPLAEAARLAPRAPETHYELGLALADASRLKEAVNQYRETLRLNPNFTAAECDLGAALYELNQTHEAIARFRDALRLDPRLAAAHFGLGLALSRVGAAKEATAEYAEAVRLDPADAKAQYNLGIALGRAGRPEEALDHLRRAVEIEPNFAEAHGNLGIALSMTGSLEDAVKEFEAALELRPNYLAAQQDLGIALLQLHRVSEARAHFEAALRIDPNFEPARAMLQRLGTAGLDR